MKNIDERIKKDIVDSLCNNDNFDASSIAVKVKNGIVELTGSVSNNDERELGRRIAKSIPQVGAVQNHIAIIREPIDDPKAHIA